MITLPPAQAEDLGLRHLQCEYPGCVEIREARSMARYKISCMSSPDDRVPSHECPSEGHFGCCIEHGIALAVACAEQHMTALHAEIVARVQARDDEKAARLKADLRAEPETGGIDATPNSS